MVGITVSTRGVARLLLGTTGVKKSALSAPHPAKRRKLLVMSSDKDSKSEDLDRHRDSLWTPEKVDTKLPVHKSGLLEPGLAMCSMLAAQAKSAGLSHAKDCEAVATSAMPDSAGDVVPCAFLDALAMHQPGYNKHDKVYITQQVPQQNLR